MSAPVLTQSAPLSTRPAWLPAVWPVAVGALLLGLLFNQEVAAAVQTWIDSTAYNHCFLVIPIAAYLLWERKAELVNIAPDPMPAAVVLGIPVALVWLAAERLGILEGRQLAALTFLQLLFLAVLGRRLYWAACGPLLYLYFLVPFGDFLTPRLQDVTTWFIRHGLAILHIPAYIDGYVIEIPQGTFFVAEACAGLRFLIASIAFGCLYALMMYRSPVRRGVYIVASIIVPIIANGFRGLGIVVLGYVLGSAQAAATDHVLYGWMFFSIVILMLIALGLPFREDTLPIDPPAPALPGPPISLGRGFSAAAIVVVLAAIGPGLTLGLAQAAGTVSAPPVMPLAEGCTTVPPPPASPPNATNQQTLHVVCGGEAFEIAWQALPPRATAGTLMTIRRRMIRPVLSEDLTQSWLGSGGESRPWLIMQADEPAYALAVGVWVDGVPTRPGLGMRMRMAIDSMVGSSHVPMVVTITPAVAWDTASPQGLQDAAAALRSFLQRHPEFDSAVGAVTAVH
jgi:exosortase A